MFGSVEKFTDFQEWLAACTDYGFSISEFETNSDEYSFKQNGAVIAYWDRKLGIGAVSVEHDFV